MKSDRKGALSPHPANGATGNRRVSTAEAEPTAGLVPVPIWLIILFALLFYFGQLYLDKNGGEFNAQVYEPYRSFADVQNANPASGPEMAIAIGKELYSKNCSPCHQETGLGGVLPPAPPLAGAEWVTASNPNRLIRIPLHGLTGPITVKGQEYNLTMPALGTDPFLPNPEENLAGLLSYIRQAWGNKAPLVTPEQVRAVLQETAGRNQPWTVEELQKIPDAP